MMFKKFGIAATMVVLIEGLFAGVVRAENNFGAIATSHATDSYGLTYDYGTRAEAEKEALSQCEKHSNATDCEVVVWFQNSCGAVAHSNNYVSWGIGESRAEAERQAQKVLPEGEIVSWACTTR